MREKTLSDKLYLAKVKSVAVINGAAHPAMAAQLPGELLADNEDDADVVLLFALSHAELEKHLPAALLRLGGKGSLWIAFLKQSAPKATDIARDAIEAYASNFGLTGIALVSLDADWSGLRLKRL